MSTWMVVEDEPDIYEVLLAMFELWGIEGVAFVDGEEASAWVDDVDNGRFRGELPELALLDIRLPGAVSGPMVGERLRKSHILGDMAIILTTAYKLTPEEQTQAMERAQADKLLPKPLPKFNELQRVLETVIAARREKTAQKLKQQGAPASSASETSPTVKSVKSSSKPGTTPGTSRKPGKKE